MREEDAMGHKRARDRAVGEERIVAGLAARVRDVPDFPKPGILFKDITPLLADAATFRTIVELLSARISGHRPFGLVAIEARGFLFGSALALAMGLPLALVRKPGKLPYTTAGVDYELEYGTDRLEIHVDAIAPGRRYAIVDDLLATGGTAAATARLVQQQGGAVACAAFVIELSFLTGVSRLGAIPVERLIRY
jgi:adenine phosphoribosyltransferase